MRSFSLCLALSLFIAGSVSADTIKLTNGTALEDVKIKSATIKEVAYRDGARNRTLESWKVAEIVPDNPPRRYREGLEALKDNDVDTAIGSFRKFIERTKPGSSHAWMIQFAYWELAKVFRSEGTKKGFLDSLAEMDALIKAIPDTIFLIKDYRIRLDYYLAQGDKNSLTNATKRIAKWIKVIEKSKLSNAYLFEAQLDLLMIERDGLKTLTAAKAEQQLAAILKAAGKVPMALNRAKTEMGMTLLYQSRADEAAKYFKEVTEKAEVDDLSMARAWLGLGQTILNKRGASRAEFKEAAICFLRVYEVFKRPAAEDGRLREVVAWALYYGESAIEGWAPPAKDGMKKKLRTIRRVRYRTTAAGRKN